MVADLSERRFLLIGFGVTNRAVAAALVRRGMEVVVTDDRVRPGDTPVELTAAADGLGVRLLPPESVDAAVFAASDAVVPTPGLPEAHPLLAAAAAAGLPMLSEFDLAAAWDDRPLVGITGTNGKTTVTTLVTEMLVASGVPAAAVGNTEVPLVEAIDDPTTEVFVVECSSFRLGWSRHFRPRAAVWLNFAEDHLDVHRDLAAYEAAKARIFAELGPGDLAVGCVDDPVVTRHLDTVRGATVARVGLDPAVADWTERDGALVLPDGTPLVEVAELHRALPHDLTNSLAASAAALSVGGTLDGVRTVLRSFTGLSHRVEFVLDASGVNWFDDSKSTSPHSTLAAVAGFDSVVLIAGGRNKGLDLAMLAKAGERVRAVVGIGEAGPEVRAAFADRPGTVAGSMEDAVRAAADLARPGDAVLLSPACASFDWYGSYAERGRDFADCVRRLIGGGATEVGG